MRKSSAASKLFLFLWISLLSFASVGAQTEVLTNQIVADMTKVGIGKEIIIKKINDSPNAFDVSSTALIELKKEGVADEVIALMLEKANAKQEPVKASETVSPGYSENLPPLETKQFAPAVGAKEALLNARTIAIEKSSLHPSRQALEKELFKRKDWLKYNLTIVRYKQDADVYIEIGRMPLSWITHRYVFRLYDRRSGTIIAAGETTSWGSLAENMAREIAQKMNSVAGK